MKYAYYHITNFISVRILVYFSHSSSATNKAQFKTIMPGFPGLMLNKGKKHREN